MSAAELEEDAVVEDLLIRLGDFAIRVRDTAVIFHNKARKNKTKSVPFFRFAFCGGIESVRYEEVDAEYVDVIIRLKQRAAP